MRFLNGKGGGTEVNNQDKEITSNGVYTADEGYTGLGEVTVNVPVEGEDSSDATATANDIINPKTAYVKGEKITGAITSVSSETSMAQFIQGDLVYTSDFGSKRNTITILPDGNHIVVDDTNLYVCDKDSILKTYALDTILSEFNAANLCLSSCKAMTSDSKNLIVLMCGQETAYFYYKNGDVDLSNKKSITYKSDYNAFAAVVGSNIESNVFYLASRGYGLYKVTIIEGDEAQQELLTNSLNLTRIAHLNLSDDDRYLIGNQDMIHDGGKHWIYDIETKKIIDNNINTLVNVSFLNIDNLPCVLKGNNIYQIVHDELVLYLDNITTVIPNTTGYPYSETTYSLYRDGIFIVGPIKKTVYTFAYHFDSKEFLQLSSIDFDKTDTKIIYSLEDRVFFIPDKHEYTIKVDKEIVYFSRAGKKYYSNFDSTATDENILDGKIAYSASGKLSGTMPDNGELVYEQSDKEQSIPLGYTSGGIIKVADITKLQEYQNCLSITESILNISPFPYVIDDLYTFYNGSMTDSINQNNGTLYGTYTQTENSIIFNGGYARTGNLSKLKGTWEIYCKINEDFTPRDQNQNEWYYCSTIFGMDDSNNRVQDFGIVMNKDGYYGLGGFGSSVYYTSLKANDGQFHHITLIIDDLGVSLYIDGNLEYTVNCTFNTGVASQYGIFYNILSTGTVVKGELKLLRYYTRSLLPEEIRINYKRCLTEGE